MWGQTVRRKVRLSIPSTAPDHPRKNLILRVFIISDQNSVLNSGGGIIYPKTFSPLTFLFLFLIPALVFGQERPATIIIPVSSLGEVNETRKQILQNTLEEQLKRYFKLVSQERFLKAQESAFEELDYEDCTEEQCIMLIQEMLKVENAFNLQLIVEGQVSQLSLNWRTLDEKRKATDILPRL